MAPLSAAHICVVGESTVTLVWCLEAWLLAAPPSLETAGCVPRCSVGQQVGSGLGQPGTALGELGLWERADSESTLFSATLPGPPVEWALLGFGFCSWTSAFLLFRKLCTTGRLCLCRSRLFRGLVAAGPHVGTWAASQPTHAWLSGKLAMPLSSRAENLLPQPGVMHTRAPVQPARHCV